MIDVKIPKWKSVSYGRAIALSLTIISLFKKPNGIYFLFSDETLGINIYSPSGCLSSIKSVGKSAYFLVEAFVLFNLKFLTS